LQTADGSLYIAHSISIGTEKAPENRNHYAEWKEAEEKEDRDAQAEKAVAQGPSQEEDTLMVPHRPAFLCVLAIGKASHSCTPCRRL
jgi:hypothetical protein